MHPRSKTEPSSLRRHSPVQCCLNLIRQGSTVKRLKAQSSVVRGPWRIRAHNTWIWLCTCNSQQQILLGLEWQNAIRRCVKWMINLCLYGIYSSAHNHVLNNWFCKRPKVFESLHRDGWRHCVKMSLQWAGYCAPILWDATLEYRGENVENIGSTIGHLIKKNCTCEAVHPWRGVHRCLVQNRMQGDCVDRSSIRSWSIIEPRMWLLLINVHNGAFFLSRGDVEEIDGQWYWHSWLGDGMTRHDTDARNSQHVKTTFNGEKPAFGVSPLLCFDEIYFSRVVWRGPASTRSVMFWMVGQCADW